MTLKKNLLPKKWSDSFPDGVLYPHQIQLFESIIHSEVGKKNKGGLQDPFGPLSSLFLSNIDLWALSFEEWTGWKNLFETFPLRNQKILFPALAWKLLEVDGGGEKQIQKGVHQLVHKLPEGYHRQWVEFMKYLLPGAPKLGPEIQVKMLHPRIRGSYLYLAFQEQLLLFIQSGKLKLLPNLFHILGQFPPKKRGSLGPFIIKAMGKFIEKPEDFKHLKETYHQLLNLIPTSKNKIKRAVLEARITGAKTLSSPSLLLRTLTPLFKAPKNKINSRLVVHFLNVFNQLSLQLNRLYELPKILKLLERLDPRSLKEHLFCTLFEVRCKLLNLRQKEKDPSNLRREVSELELPFNRIWCLSTLGLSLNQLGEGTLGMDMVNQALKEAETLESGDDRDRAFSNLVHTLTSIGLEKNDPQIMERAVQLFPQICEEKQLSFTGTILYESFLTLATHLKRPDYLKRSNEFLQFPIEPSRRLELIKKQATAFLIIGEKGLANEVLEQFENWVFQQNFSEDLKKELLKKLKNHRTDLERQEFFLIGAKIEEEVRVYTGTPFRAHVEVRNTSYRILELKIQCQILKESGQRILKSLERTLSLAKDQGQSFPYPITLDEPGIFQVIFKVFDAQRPRAFQETQIKVQVLEKPPEIVLINQSQKNLNQGEWNRFWIRIGNKSERDAKEITATLSGPLEVRYRFKKIPDLKSKRTFQLKFSLKPSEKGELPVDIDIEYTDLENRFFTRTFFLNLLSEKNEIPSDVPWLCPDCAEINPFEKELCGHCGREKN